MYQPSIASPLRVANNEEMWMINVVDVWSYTTLQIFEKMSLFDVPDSHDGFTTL